MKLVPGTTVPVLGVIDAPPLLSVLVTHMSFCGVRLSLSVAELLAVLVSLAAFFFNDTATTEIYALSLHDALPISTLPPGARLAMVSLMAPDTLVWPLPLQGSLAMPYGSHTFTATVVSLLGPVLVTVMV